MTKLVISLRGEIVSSNFDEWKEDLISRVRAVNSELKTDAQFAQAEIDVKRFKEAEATLKKATQSAIEQAADIQKLFAAIDEVSAEVRDVRLQLSRQIRERKKEIKEEFIQFGVTTIQSYIERQDEDFRTTDNSEFVARKIFESAAKYKSNIKALSTAIDAACFRVQTEIDRKAELVRENAIKLNALPVGYQALFQDRGALLSLATEQLDEVIDQRITLLNQEQRKPAPAVDLDLVDLETGEILEGEKLVSGSEDSVDATAEKTFVVEMVLYATRSDAEFFLKEVVTMYAKSSVVKQVRLVDPPR